MNGNWWRVLAGAAVAMVLAAQPAAADDADTCRTASGDAAIAACTRAINSGIRGSELAEILLYRGTAYKMKDDLNRAIADFSETIRLDPKSPFAYGQRGLVYNQKRDYDHAIADLTRFIALNPGRQYLANAYIARAMAYAAKDRFDPEIADLTEAIALRPDYALLFKTRGSAYEVDGQRDKAIADYRAVLRIDPADQEVKRALERLDAVP